MIAGLIPASNAWAENSVAIGGVIEAEYGAVKFDDGTRESGYALATVELGIDAKLNEFVDGHILVLHEDGATEPWEVDEATITVHAKNNLYFVSAGRMFVPFGHYDSNMISDPLTLELGEIREAALQAGMEEAGITLSGFTFNGDTIEASDALAGNDEADQYGYAISYTLEEGPVSFAVGAGYINNIADTDGISGNLAAPELVQYVAGNSAFLQVAYKPVSIIVEQVSAADEFDVTELAWQARGAQPVATNSEIAVSFPVGGMEMTVAAGKQTTEEAVALGLPETRSLAAVRIAIYDKTTLAFESMTEDDYSLADGGTGETTKTTTVQLAMEF